MTYKNTEIIKEKASFVVVLLVINQNELARTFLKLSLIKVKASFSMRVLKDG